MKNIFFMALVVIVVACTAFILGAGYGRQLEREIQVIKSEDVDQAELQKWEHKMEVSHGQKSFEKNKMDS